MSVFHVHQPSGFLLREGESPVEFLDPLEGSSTLDDPAELAAVLQDELHTLLGAYLNGDGLDRWSSYLYPWFWRRPVESHERSRRRLAVIARLLPGGGPSFTPLRDHIADVLAGGHRALEHLLGKIRVGHEASVPAASIYDRREYAGAATGYLRPVRDLMDEMGDLAPYYRAFFLHGSMATLDYAPGFSDLDTLLILRRNVVLDARQLDALRRRIYPLQRHMYRLDPLQHHGFMVVTEIDLDWYPESYFPLDLLRYAKCLDDPPALLSRRRNSRPEQRQQLWSIGQWMRRRLAEGDKGADPYAAKLLTSFLLLLPALFLQGVGEPTYKKYSFDRLPSRFPGDTAVLRLASRWRSESFPDVRGGLMAVGDWPVGLVRGSGGRRMRRRMPPLAAYRDTLSEGIVLTDSMLELVPR